MTLDALKAFIADLARPFSIYVTSGAAGVATVAIAFKVGNFAEGAIFIGAVFAGLTGLYGLKSWEISKAGKHAAEVEVAKAKAP